MKTTNENVAINWYRNTASTNHGGSMSTNGKDLYSYNLLIGFTTQSGKKILLDYTAATGHFQSMTTSTKHISPTRYIADEVMNPSVIQNTEILKNRKQFE